MTSYILAALVVLFVMVMIALVRVMNLQAAFETERSYQRLVEQTAKRFNDHRVQVEGGLERRVAALARYAGVSIREVKPDPYIVLDKLDLKLPTDLPQSGSR